MSNNTGGPAFPVQSIYVEDQETNSHGMTLRDYFAAKAMQGLLANPKLHQHILKVGQSWIEDSSYAWADAMLKAREE